MMSAVGKYCIHIFFLRCSARTRSLQAMLSLIHTEIHVNGLLASGGPFFEKHIENAFNFSCKAPRGSLPEKRRTSSG